MKSTAYSMLRDAFIYRNDAISMLKRSDKKMVFMLGDDVPEEVIIAAGFQPVRLMGHCGPRPNADRYLESSFGTLWRGLFESLTNGQYDYIMDYLVLSNSSDIIQKLYYYLRQLSKIEPCRYMPEMHYIDYSLIARDYRAQERNAQVTKAFIARAEKWCGHKITDAALIAASVQCNAHRQAVRDIAELRHSGVCRITGVEAMTAIVGSFFIEKDQAIELLCTLAKDAASWPPCDGIRVYYTGSLQETTDVYEQIELAGGNVISEDKLFGDRYADCDVDLSLPIGEAIAMRYHLRFPSSERSPVHDRARCVPERIAEVCGEALVIVMNHNDESYIWDYPQQKEKLDTMKIPVLMLENQDMAQSEPEMQLKAMKAFFDSVKGG